MRSLRRRPGPARRRKRSPSRQRLAGVAAARRQPRVAIRIQPRIVGVQVDEATLDERVAHFEHVTPTAGMGDAGTPLTVSVLAVAGALTGERIGPGHDPVECCVVVNYPLQGAADIAEEL